MGVVGLCVEFRVLNAEATDAKPVNGPFGEPTLPPKGLYTRAVSDFELGCCMGQEIVAGVPPDLKQLKLECRSLRLMRW